MKTKVLQYNTNTIQIHKSLSQISQIGKRDEQVKFFPPKKKKEKKGEENCVKVGGNSRSLIGGTVCVRNRPYPEAAKRRAPGVALTLLTQPLYRG